MTNEELRQLAIVGARSELQRILTVFPELRREITGWRGADVGVARQSARKAGATVRVEVTPPTNGHRARRPMSAKARQAQSRRMKAFWAARRSSK